MIKYRFLLFALLAAFLASCQTTDPDAHSVTRNPNAVKLSSSEIETLVVGKTLTLPGITGAVRYHKNGRYEYFQQGFRYRGKYQISNDRACARLERGSVTCGEFYRVGNTYYWSNPKLRHFESQVTEIKSI